MKWLLALGLAIGFQAPPTQEPDAGERVRIQSSGDVTIVAEFVGAGIGSPGVIFFPMCSPIYTTGWRPLAQRLKAVGVSSLAVSYRGWAGSTGSQPPQDRPLNAQKYWSETWGPDADAALAYLRTRLGADAAIATGGASCGMHMALDTAMKHPTVVKAVVAMAGPSTEGHATYLKSHSAIAALAVVAERDHNFVGSVKAIGSSSPHAASELVIVPGGSHGTELFKSNAALVDRIAQWLRARLRPDAR